MTWLVFNGACKPLLMLLRVDIIRVWHFKIQIKAENLKNGKKIYQKSFFLKPKVWKHNQRTFAYVFAIQTCTSLRNFLPPVFCFLDFYLIWHQDKNSSFLFYANFVIIAEKTWKCLNSFQNENLLEKIKFSVRRFLSFSRSSEIVCRKNVSTRD